MAQMAALSTRPEILFERVGAAGIVTLNRPQALNAVTFGMVGALTRQLMYLAALWTEPGGPDSLALSCVSGVILDLTGRSPTQTFRLHSAIIPGCHLELTVLRRSLADESAARYLRAVEQAAFCRQVRARPLCNRNAPVATRSR